MTKLFEGKINQLERLLPEGLLVDATWMEAHGYSRSLRKQYVSRGWLQQPARSVYRRHRGSLSWEQVVISLQTLLHYPVSVGGRSALELQGYSHYLLKNHKAVFLYADSRLPGWLNKLPGCPEFEVYNRSRFLPRLETPGEQLALERDGESLQDLQLPESLRAISWGQWNWPLIVSSPERAILEVIDDLPGKISFEMVDKFMESLVDLSPRRVQRLLEAATSIKVKRLFFFFAERHRHQWLERIHREKIDLGSGKRVIVKSGKLDKTYQITVPEDMYNSDRLSDQS